MERSFRTRLLSARLVIHAFQINESFGSGCRAIFLKKEIPKIGYKFFWELLSHLMQKQSQ
jgi:hypothetical protein